MPNPYPAELRAQVVDAARVGDMCIAEIARAFGVSQSAAARWIRFGVSDTPSWMRDDDAERTRDGRQLTMRPAREVEVLREIARYLATLTEPRRMYPLVEVLAAEAIPVSALCRTLGISKQGFYHWRRRHGRG
ncbi:MAG: putative transposase [Pseudonocardiales bacterium]|jgi:transposase-like protein|nr:putative transposase [Pseudonocardiales bacterium]